MLFTNYYHFSQSDPSSKSSSSLVRHPQERPHLESLFLFLVLQLPSSQNVPGLGLDNLELDITVWMEVIVTGGGGDPEIQDDE